MVSDMPCDATGRRLHDAYYTPLELARAAVRVLDLPRVGTVLEPSVGDGAWVEAAREVSPDLHIIGLDIQAGAAGLARVDTAVVTDFMEFGRPELRALPVAVDGVTWVIGNPPFSAAVDHVEHALGIGANVAMLLRIAFLAGVERYQRLYAAVRPSEVHALVQRPSFTGKGSDRAQEYALLVWRRLDEPGPRPPTTFEWLNWRTSRRRGSASCAP